MIINNNYLNYFLLKCKSTDIVLFVREIDVVFSVHNCKIYTYINLSDDIVNDLIQYHFYFFIFLPLPRLFLFCMHLETCTVRSFLPVVVCSWTFLLVPHVFYNVTPIMFCITMKNRVCVRQTNKHHREACCSKL